MPHAPEVVIVFRRMESDQKTFQIDHRTMSQRPSFDTHCIMENMRQYPWPGAATGNSDGPQNVAVQWWVSATAARLAL
jgi:hypothetical protein